MKISIYFIRFSTAETSKHKILMTENNVFLCFGTQSKCYVYSVSDVQKEKRKHSHKTYVLFTFRISLVCVIITA